MAWNDAPGTTNISGAAFGNPTAADLAAAARRDALNEQASYHNANLSLASRREDVADRVASGTRGAGLMTKYRPVGGWPGVGGGGGPAGGAPAPSLEEASLGAPTSYAGGAPIDESGNAQPGLQPSVGVVRGMRQTSAVNTGGSQMSEFTTPQAAGQAVNRAAGVGEFVTPEAPKMELAARLRADQPDTLAHARALNAQAGAAEATTNATNLGTNRNVLKNTFMAEHGTPGETPGSFKMPADENLNRIHRSAESMVMAGTHTPGQAYEAVKPDIYNHYYTPANIEKGLAQISQITGQPVTPERRAAALAGTPEVKRDIYPFIQQALKQPTPGWGQRITNAISPAPAYGAGLTPPTTDFVSP